MSKTPRNVTLRVLEGGRVDESGDYIEDVFGAKGYLAKLVKGYQPRLGQMALARAIDQGIREGRHVISEGPTGTGKSLAYSVPAAYHAIHSRKKICIVTANKTLQSQIVNKDLEELRAATGWKFSFMIRKGLSNYLCSRDYARGIWSEALAEDPDAEDMISAMRDWADTTEDGDREGSPGPSNQLWKSFSTTHDDCATPKNCPSAEDCFADKAKNRAKATQIIVTNYHLFYRHLTFEARRLREAEAKCKEENKEWDLELYNKKLRQNNNGILPVFDVVIMDEAHHAPEIARDHLGEDATVSWSLVQRCISGLHEAAEYGGRTAEATRMRAMTWLNSLWDGLEKRLVSDLVVFGPGDELESAQLEQALHEVATAYTAAARSATLPPGKKALSGRDIEMSVVRARFDKMAARCHVAAAKLKSFRVRDIDSLVYFAEKETSDDGRSHIKLKAKALQVGRFMREELFDKFPTVVQTSATLAIKTRGSSDFDHVRREMGMRNMTRVIELAVPSPFDWHSQALLVVPRTMPLYDTKSKDDNAAYNQAALEHMESIIKTVKGRTLVLFTSHKSMKRAAVYLRDRLPYEVYVQGEGTNLELQRKFRSNVDSVLLGTESFAEGVDIQGEACSCVILEKLSFAPPNDPILVGLKMQNQELLRKDPKARIVDVFNEYSVPAALTKFKQRTGRLLRSIRDVGAIVCLDRRVTEYGYGYRFIGSIPPIRISKDLSDIAPFLRSLGALTD